MKQYKETLYIKDQLGKIRQWSILYDESSYVKKYGVLNGELITSNPVTPECKNIGKANETTLEQQVLKEVKSEYEHQRKRGYKSLSDLNLDVIVKASVNFHHLLDRLIPISKTDENNYLKPMKAQKYQVGSIKFPCIIQPKINGVRATAKLVEKDNGLFGKQLKAELKSKEGLVYEIEHLEKLCTKLLNGNKDLVLDGELYISGQPVTSIGGAARNKNNPLHKELAFVVFDLSIPNLSQIERIVQLFDLFYRREGEGLNVYAFTDTTFNYWNESHNITRGIFRCPVLEVNTEDEIAKENDKFLISGFEGTIIRDKDAEYAFGSRVKTMRKLKKYDDAEFIIIDIIPGEKDGKPIFICKNDITDDTFKVDGTVEFLDTNILNNKQNYIGKKATVKFYERTKNGLPFHCTLIAIRDYE